MQKYFLNPGLTFILDRVHRSLGPVPPVEYERDIQHGNSVLMISKNRENNGTKKIAL